MAHSTTMHEGKSVTLTEQETARYDAGDNVIAEVADRLPPGDYSIYAADGGPLLQNIHVT